MKTNMVLILDYPKNRSQRFQLIINELVSSNSFHGKVVAEPEHAVFYSDTDLCWFVREYYYGGFTANLRCECI